MQHGYVEKEEWALEKMKWEQEGEQQEVLDANGGMFSR